MKIKSVGMPLIFMTALLVPTLLRAASAPIYTKILKVGGDTMYVSKGILGSAPLFACSIISLNCTPTDSLPTQTSLTLTAISGIKFRSADLSILIAFTQEQGVTKAFFYHKDDYTAYKVVTFPFLPTKAMFSDDGSSIVFFGSLSGTASLFRLPLSTYEPEAAQSFSLTDIYTLRLSPDGNWLAYYKAASETQRVRTIGLYSLVAKKHYTTVSKHIYWDLLKEVNREFVFSSDSKYMAYLDDRDGYTRPYVVTLSSTTKDAKGIAAGYKGWTTQDMIFSGSTLLYVHNEKDPYQWNLSKYDVVKQKTTLLATSISYGENIQIAGSYVLVMQENPYAYLPVRVEIDTSVVSPFVFPTTTTTIDTTGTIPSPILKRESIVSGTLHGSVTTNTTLKNTDKKPLVIWLHGGPFRQSAKALHPWQSYGVYDWALDELAETGDARILKLDYRGSFGFGKIFASKIQKEVGRGDVAEVVQMLNAYKRKYGTTKVYLVGNSYGGYLALRSLVGYPATFAGVLSINGVTDWQDLLYQYQTSIFNTLFYGAPSKTNKYMYDRASVLFRINRIKADHKIYIMQSDRDDTILPSQAPLLTNALEKLHKPYELTMLAGENHVLTKPESVQTVCTRLFSLVAVSPDNHCVFAGMGVE